MRALSFIPQAVAAPSVVGINDARLCGRPYLIDSNEPYFPQTLNPEIDSDFPKVFCLRSGAAESAGPAAKRLVDAELSNYGALVLRGLPLARDGAPQACMSFSNFLFSTGYDLTKYVGGVTIRPETDPMVYPASDEDPHVCMDLHQDSTHYL